MSILSRLSSRFRQDSAYTTHPTWTTASTRNAPPTFTPKLVREQIDKVDDLAHLGRVAREDPLAYYGTYGLANEALGDGFVLVDEDGEEHVQNKDIQRELRLLNAKDVVIQALAYERAYGYSYIYKGKNRYVPDTPTGARLASLHAFTPEECVVKRYSDTGEPLVMEVTVNVGEGEYTTREKKITLPAQDFIFINTRPIGRGYQGKSVLEPIWDDLTHLRYIMSGMVWFDMKIGQGLFVVKTRAGLKDELVSKLNVTLEDMSHRRVFLVDGNKIEEIDFKGAGAGATDFGEHINACLQRVACGLGVPLDILIGASGGTNEAAATNEKSSHKTISEVQGDIEHVFQDIIESSGWDMVNMYFEWKARYAHDEEERANIEFITTQSNVQKNTYMTIDEIREEMGLAPLPDGRGDKLAGEVSSFNMNIEGLQSPEEMEQTQNPQGAQI